MCTILGSNGRIIRIVLFHAIFANFGDLEASIMNFMTVPVRNFVAASLEARYNINTTIASAEFELIYSTITSMFFFGALFGGFMMDYLMDDYGRKGTAVYIRTMLGIASAVSTILAKYLGVFELLIIGQFLAGFVSALKVVLFIYISECSPDDKRGFCAMALGAGGNLLFLIAAPFCLPQAFGTDRDWWLLPAVCLFLALIYIVVAGLFPESPKHLFIVQRMCISSRHAIRFYHGEEADIDSVILEYDRERRLIHHENVAFFDILKSPRLRFCTIIILINAFVGSNSLINVKSQYLETMLMKFNLDQSQALMTTMLMTAIASPICIITPFMIEQFGRRPIFLIISVFVTLEIILISLAQFIVDINSNWGILKILTSVFGVSGFSMGAIYAMLGLLNMNYILISELCPHTARALVSKIALIIPTIYTLILVLSYPTLTEKYGAAFMLPLLVFSVILFMLSYKYLPETKGLPVDTIYKSLAPSTNNSESSFLSDPTDLEISCPKKFNHSSKSMYGSLSKNSVRNEF